MCIHFLIIYDEFYIDGYINYYRNNIMLYILYSTIYYKLVSCKLNTLTIMHGQAAYYLLCMLQPCYVC